MGNRGEDRSGHVPPRRLGLGFKSFSADNLPESFQKREDFRLFVIDQPMPVTRSRGHRGSHATELQPNAQPAHESH